MQSGIYRITNLVNNKQYVGQSSNLYQRLCQHKSDLRSNRHSNKHLQNSWNKYGEDNFKFEIIKLCDIEQLCEMENYFLSLVEAKLRFNVGEIAESPFLGQKHRLESKIKISNSKLGKKIRRSEEHKQKLREIGRKRSRSVMQIQPETNLIIKIYSSLKSAESDGFVVSQISMCANGHIKTHKGYVWKFVPPDLAVS